MLAEHQETVISNISSKVDYLSEALESILSENKNREEHVLRNETYSRRDNLIFRGYTVARDDPETCESEVRNVSLLWESVIHRRFHLLGAII